MSEQQIRVKIIFSFRFLFFLIIINKIIIMIETDRTNKNEQMAAIA